MKIINHPNMTLTDLIKVGAYYQANKKTIKQQKLAKDCYEFVKQFINNELHNKAELQPKDGKFYKHLDYHQNIKFNDNADESDLTKFVKWIESFTNNKVKTSVEFDDNCYPNIKITYK